MRTGITFDVAVADRARLEAIGAAPTSAQMHDSSVALARLDALLTWDIEERWPLLDCPIETINSALLSENALMIDLVGLSVHLMEDVGHFPMLEDAETFNALASGILKRCFREA